MKNPIAAPTANIFTANLASEIFLDDSPSNEKIALPADPLATIMYWDENQGELPDGLEVCFSCDKIAALSYPLYIEKYRDFFIPPQKYVDKANEIRDYYRNKYSFRIFMGDHVSPTQKAIADLVSSNPTEVYVDSLPMLVSLPRMYEDDMQIENAMKDFTSIDKDVFDTLVSSSYVGYPGTPIIGRKQHDLSFVSVSRRKMHQRKSAARHDFWFRNNNNHLVRYTLPAHTQEAEFFKRILEYNSGKIKLMGNTGIRRLFNNEFYYYHIIGNVDIE